METSDSLSQFFYNIVPGFLFLLTIDYLLGFKFLTFLPYKYMKDKEILFAFAFLSLSLFIGFIFQGFTKFVRKRLEINQKIWEKIKNDNSSSFKKSVELLRRMGLLDEKTDLKEIFYLMNNYLEGEQKAALSKFFSLRVAFWSNMFFAIYFLIPITVWVEKYSALIILLFLFPYSYWLFETYLKIHYDTVLKTFVTVTNFKKNNI